MACQVNIVPVRVRAWNNELRCDAARVVGYRAVCSCGVRSGVQKNVTQARAEISGHTPPVVTDTVGDAT